ncbi:MAG: LPS assembly protein LptD [Planctomycetota bacterium]|nr:LPS assembly protein LptD [Planctomycetota bacterium]
MMAPRYRDAMDFRQATRLLAHVAGAAIGLGLAGSALAQNQPTPSTSTSTPASQPEGAGPSSGSVRGAPRAPDAPGVDASAITGRDFAGVAMPIAALEGPIRLNAVRAWTWREPTSQATTGGITSGVQHLVLDGDVRVRLGLFQFVARRAVLRIQRLPASREFQGKPTYQVFAFFQDVGSPTADAAISVSAKTLPVRGLLAPAEGVQLRADALVEGEPGEADAPELAALLRQSEAVLSDYVRELLGLPTSAERERARAAEERAQRRAERLASRPEPIRRRPTRADGAESQPADPAQRAATDPAPGDDRTPDPRQGPLIAESPRPATRVRENRGQPLPARRVAQRDAIFASTGSVSVAPGKLQFISGEQESALVASEGVIVQYTDAAQERTLEISAQRAVVFLEGSTLQDMARLSVDQIRGIYLEGDVVAGDGNYTLRGPRMFYDLVRNKGVVLDAVFWTYDRSRGLPLYVRASTIRQESARQFSAEEARLSTTAFFTPDLQLGASAVTITRERSDLDGLGRTGDLGRPGAPEQTGANQSPLAGGGRPSASPVGSARGLDTQRQARAGTSAFGPGLESSQAAATDGLGGAGDAGQAAADRTIVRAENVTLRAGSVPFFYWPGFTGDPEQFPLKDLRFESSNGSGPALKTVWDAYALAGVKKPDDVNVDLLLDGYIERGIGLGAEAQWASDRSKGKALGYVLPEDRGEDLLKSGFKKDIEGDTRGIASLEQRWRLDDRWSVLGEANYISDENFIDAFFEEQGENRREFTSQFAVQRRVDTSLAVIQAKTTFNDFLANEYLLLSQGYTTSRLPEVSYFATGEDLLADSSPGLLTWFGEFRAGRLSLNFDEIRPRDRGIVNDRQAQNVFGVLDARQTLAESLRAQGYFEEAVTRLDTRQELTSQLSAGPVNVTPFVVGRITAYDDQFDRLSPDENDNARLWGSVGTRVATTITKVDDSVRSDLLDLRRIRHIVEPHATLSHAGTTVDSEALPVYDDAVEGLTEGSQTRLGVSQTWQTRRGPEGRDYSVDVFKLDTDVVLASGERDRGSPIGRFYDPRPELSEAGNFFIADGAWQVTDAVALVGSSVFDLDLSRAARNSTGVNIDHGLNFASFIEMREIDSQDTVFLDLGGRYQLTSKYGVSAVTSYDTKRQEWQTVSTSIQRRSAAVLFGFDFNYNTITGETSFGFLVRPVGTRGGAAFRGLGASEDTEQRSTFGG